MNMCYYINLKIKNINIYINIRFPTIFLEQPEPI